jgi:hypothetical protein
MEGIRTEQDACRFMKSVKFALRYGATPGLPLPSIYSAAKDKRLAIELTNALLARGEAIETNVLAGRLVLAHRDVVPALYALRIRFRADRLSNDAERALELIRANEGATAGDVRRLLGVRGAKRPDRADEALEELMREMLVDRGPSSVPERGIPYLSREGFPYRAFEKAHPELIAAAKKLSIRKATVAVLAPLRDVPPRRLASMLRLCLRQEELAPG